MRSLSRIIKASSLIFNETVRLALVKPAAVSCLNQETKSAEAEMREPSFNEEMANKLIKEAKDKVQELLEQARLQAQEIVESARSEAEQIKQAAAEEAEIIKKKSREEGYQAGFQAGKQQAVQETEQARQAIISEAQAILEKAQIDREKMLAEVEPQVVQLAIELARKVIWRELTINPETIRDIAREALVRAGRTGELVIKVSKDFYEPLNTGLKEIFVSEEERRHCRVEIDDTVEPGGCIVDTGAGYVDAQITSQLDRIIGVFNQVNPL